jgi:hypothetical protein
MISNKITSNTASVILSKQGGQIANNNTANATDQRNLKTLVDKNFVMINVWVLKDIALFTNRDPN